MVVMVVEVLVVAAVLVVWVYMVVIVLCKKEIINPAKLPGLVYKVDKNVCLSVFLYVRFGRFHLVDLISLVGSIGLVRWVYLVWFHVFTNSALWAE